MEILIDWALQGAWWLVRGLWLVLGNFLCAGVLCFLTALYGVGSDWPLGAVVPFAVAGLAAWTVSARGGLRRARI